MYQSYRIAPRIALLLGILCLVGEVGAATYYSRQSGTWTDGNSWSTASCGGAIAGSAPSSSDDVIICAGHTIKLNSNALTANSITITGASAVLDISSNQGGWPQQLTVSNDVYVDDGGSIVEGQTYVYHQFTCTNMYIGTNTAGATTQSVTINAENSNTTQFIVTGTLEIGNCSGTGTSSFSYTPNLTGAGNGANTLTIGTRIVHSSGATYTCSPSGGSAPACPATTADPPCGYYVNDGSTSGDRWCTAVGNDANDGLTPATPKATLADMLDDYDLGADDTVRIDHGTYSWTGINWADAAYENNDYGTGDGNEFVIQGAGSSGTYVADITSSSGILFNFPNSSDVYDYIQFIDLKLTGASGSHVFFLAQPDYIEIDGCQVYSVGAAAPIYVFNDADYLTISDNYLSGSSANVIHFEQSVVTNFTTITRNVIDGNGTATDGIYFDQNGSDYTITNNYFANSTTGIAFTQAVTNTVVYNNSFYNRDYNIYGQLTNMNIRNNIFQVTGGAAGDYCINMTVDASPTMDYNLYYYTGSATPGYRPTQGAVSTFDGGGTDWQGLFSNDANSIGGSDAGDNPDYNDPSNDDLDIDNTSPAADAGVINLVTVDIYGNSRDDATNDEMGAMEVCAAANAGSDVSICDTELWQVTSHNAVAPFAAASTASVNSGTTVARSGTATISKTIYNPPPASMFSIERYGNHDYTFDGLDASTKYLIRLFFAETYFGTGGDCGCGTTGSRVFDVQVNGATVLDDYDILTETSGNAYVAVAKEVYATTDGSGEFSVDFINVTDNAVSYGIEILRTDQLTASGGGTYSWSNGATDATIDVPATDSTYTVTVTNGSCTSNDAATVSTSCTASVTLASDNPAVAAASICTGLTRQPIYKFSLATADASTTLNQLDFTTTNTAAADISKYQLYYSTTDNFGPATQIGSDITASLGTGSHSFTGLTQTLTAGTTAYFWISVDVESAATATNTIVVSALTTGDITLSAGNKSGSANAGGTQTIAAGMATSIVGSDGYADEYLSQDAIYQVSAFTTGGYDVSPWSDGSGYITGGTTVSRADAVNTASLTNAAPQDVYRLERFDPHAYDFTTGMDANTRHFIRFHFAETFHTSNGARIFDVDVNGTKVIDDLDVHAQVGHDVGYIVEVTADTDGDGDLYIDYTENTGDCISYGTEIYVAGTLTASGGGSYLWDTGETTPTIDVGPTEGTHYVTVTNGSCTAFLDADVIDADVLPVELGDFRAECEEERAVIRWRTESEINNDYFLLDKSPDGLDFDQLAKVYGAGNSNQVNHYLSFDYEPFANGTHYQLTQVDFDGTIHSNPSIYLADDCQPNSGPQIKALYQGFDQDLHLFFGSGNNVSYELSVYSADGALVHDITGTSKTTHTHIELRGDIFSTGVYLFVVQVEGQLLSQKLYVGR